MLAREDSSSVSGSAFGKGNLHSQGDETSQSLVLQDAME